MIAHLLHHAAQRVEDLLHESIGTSAQGIPFQRSEGGGIGVVGRTRKESEEINKSAMGSSDV